MIGFTSRIPMITFKRFLYSLPLETLFILFLKIFYRNPI
ncbi:hypothetical protein LEP1GSC201_2940 [Leptospira interrogans serovar Pomona str. Fox 32256]|nr:hypothetical protein LEP1GSC201_2940 [Leptospira interrogans serovar Pomona str. Fox 32256]EMN82799.1 hypothetical protein LEP1GSC106_1160 [Leptospira interrogans serovar Grippotyphosa str. UI 12764]